MSPIPIPLSFLYLSSFFIFSISLPSLVFADRLSIEQQLPLIARVGQPYQWTISMDTFSSSDDISAKALPSWLSYSGLTFSGTPSANDEGANHVTLTSEGEQDSFTLCVTHFPAPDLHIPLQTQFVASNPSMSSVFFPNSTSALAGANPTVRVPPLWSFSIGMEWDTFLNPSGELFYYALQADGTPLPSWITFSERSMTFDGVAHAPEGSKLGLALIGSDQAGYSAQRLLFDLIVSAHDLDNEGPVPPVNVTAGEEVNFDFDVNDWIFGDIRVDGTSLSSMNITSLSVDTSSAPWLSFADRTLRGRAPTSTGQYPLPIKITAANQTVSLNTTLVLLPPYFSTPRMPDAFASPGDSFSVDISKYESNSPGFSGHAVELSAYFAPNSTSAFLSLVNGVVKGSIPHDPGSSHANVTIKAYDHSTHASSEMSLLISFRQPNKDVTSFAALSQRHRLVLGLSISLGGIAGLVLLAGLMAAIRKWCHVRDTAVDSYNGKDNSADLEAIGIGGYGYTEKIGDDGVEIMTVPKAAPGRYGNLGLGIGYTPGPARNAVPDSLLPGSPPPRMTTKQAFFKHVRAAARAVSASGAAISSAASRTVSASGTGVKNAVRKVSAGTASISSTPNSREAGRGGSVRASIGAIGKSIRRGVTRKSAISRPVLLFTKDSHQHLRQEVGNSSSGSPGSLLPNPNIHFHGASDGESVNVPEGDGLSLGFRSSPSSSAGHTMETTTTETRTTTTTGMGTSSSAQGPYATTVRSNVPIPAPAVVKKNVVGKRKSTDTMVTESSGGCRDAEEAVIATASRAHSFRSEFSSYTYVPSADQHTAPPSTVPTRPKLVQFTSARGVPVPTLSAYNAAEGGPNTDRRVSQIADVVPVDDDLIMTEGMRYVRAFGDHDDPASLRPDPSRSNSKRSSMSRGRLSPATTTQTSSSRSGGSGEGTVSSRSGTSYEYPTPSQTADLLGIDSRRSSSLSRSGSRGSTRRRRERSDSTGTGESGGSGGGGGRGDLMMSRILVRSGETFKFKYPVLSASTSASPSSPGSQEGVDIGRKLSARLLYGRGLPAFLSYAIAPHSASSTPASNKSPGKSSRKERERERTEMEFWGTPRAADVGEIVVGIFEEGGGEGERCVGRLVVEVVAKG